MDEILFENRYDDDEARNLEAIREVTLHGFYRSAPLVKSAVLAALAIAGFLVRQPWLSVPCLALAVLLLLFYWFTPRVMHRLMKAETLRLNNGQLPESTVQFGERILLREGALQLSTEYDQVVEIRPLERSIALMTGPSSAILFVRDAFTVGTCEDCLAFLREKCPNLNNPGATRPSKSMRRRRIARIVGSVMLGIAVGVALEIEKILDLIEVCSGTLPPLSIVYPAVCLWMGISLLLLIAPRKLFH